VFNIASLGTGNGLLLLPLLNKTQSLAGNRFGGPVFGNRGVFLQSTFTS
jgi:hypothetical protein